jgi:hypothetical protein
VKAGLLFSFLLLINSLRLIAQGEKPMYLSFSYGADQNLEKADRILTEKPTFLNLTFEKRLPKSDFYGIGLSATRFVSVFDNYNILTFRGYQHFGYAADASGGNIDPYIGAFLGGEVWKGSFKPAVGIFIGLRTMFTQTAGLHIEFISTSSGFNSSTLLQFGITTCFMRSEIPKFKKWGNRCPKRK